MPVRPAICADHRCLRVLLAFVFAGVFAPSAGPASAEDAPFPRELVAFVPVEANPVFVAGGDGKWDARIRERGWILREGDQYRMWYTGYDGTREGLKMLGHATSPDGIHWTRSPGNPIHSEHWVEDVMVLRHEGRYLMFAEGKGDAAQLLTSPDGMQWTRQGALDVRRTDGTPIAPGPYGTPTVWLEDGVWHLFYERRDAGVWLATSRDLKVWRKVQEAPVLSPGPAAADRDLIALNQIVKHGGRYYALYHGGSNDHSPVLWSTNIAVSDDLRNWTKYSGNPLRPVSENKSSGILVHDGEKYRLYTMHDKVDVHVPVR